MAPRRAEDLPIKRIAAPGCRLPTRLPLDEILTDITQKDWRLGPRLGCGGFGDIYLASEEIHKAVGQDAKYVIKIEPHHNGPLFVEMNFYIRAARQHMIKKWCDSQSLSRIGIPSYEGSGSHIYKGERFRFLVIPRYGIDVGQLFQNYGRKLPTKLVNNLAGQMLDALEYIHSHGYAHSDVKSSNIILEDVPTISENPRAYLVDYGLAYRFRTTAGAHKPFVHDERRAHEGTLEFTSRDAHHGTHSRRGDMETLGYNILQWLCGRLPWEREQGGMSPTSNPDDIHSQKELFLSDITNFMKVCFPDRKKPPAAITAYMKYIATLDFEAKPNYSYLRSLFTPRGKAEREGLASSLGKRLVADENISYLRPKKMPYLRERRPCKPVNCEGRITRNHQALVETEKFSWEEVLARHPDKLAKISVVQTNGDDVIHSLTPPPSPPPPSLPTYAMLHVLQRMKDRQTGTYRHKSKFNEELKAKWMTPAMEEVAQLKKKVQSVISMTEKPISPRITRSRVARLNRK
ncbi:serine/threonine-protein kinase VRK1 [Fopius arisanus]|uniref:non-specific serine/threonine protein kinase n=1 Tax=Fopius arisanus TaxID=64838 RepID=A0A0C9R2K3_9HYME|nr:PREDICTED: serine/threonine-protein kinase VRK1-like [Fopius arisanus]XP_011300001.1 PREDICTED: serine/threonine-protein kinase VRK1-like [Fopius arisanus]XP_011300002.1 PREDICTED: serine/threonine-protein kinase VRK1-like [Fopius arisanus]XP_011300003.1 PREDICTED: serine/threonine-protein kinase VRK1-like [Fopius arisanus]